MAVKIVHAVTGEPAGDRFGAAERYGRCLIGQDGVAFPQRLSKKFLTWGDLSRAFLRVQEVNAKMCCGSANFDLPYLILRTKDGVEFSTSFSERREADRALEAIQRFAPDLPIGFIKEE